MARPPTPRRGAFTLTELIVLVAIVAVLIALLLPAIHKVRRTAARMRSADHLARMGAAFRAHHDAHGALPHGGSGTSPTDRTQWSWAYQILPFLGKECLHGASTSAVDTTPIEVYYIPGRRSATLYNGFAKIDYAGNAGTGTDGVLVRGPVAYIRFLDITNGTSSTVMVGEKQLNPLMFGRSLDDDESYARPGWKDDFEVHRLGSAQPARDSPLEGDPTPSPAFGSPLRSGFNCVFADGSVRHVRYNVSLLTWKRACARNDEECPGPNGP
jgi:type II secretory pathway pseudopilin PulG